MAVVAAGLLGYVVGWLDHRADLPDGWSVISGEARVVDGDTIEIDGVRVRLHGLDAPERYQRCLTSAGEEYRCGARATDALRRVLGATTKDPRVYSAIPVAAGAALRLMHEDDDFSEVKELLVVLGLDPRTFGSVQRARTRNIVTCLSHDTDRWGRRIARCFTDDADINRWLVQNGHALAYRRYSREYDIDETHALEYRRGLWSGRFVPPQAWRRGKRLR